MVYRDDNYPISWIEYNNADKIVNYLTSHYRPKKFSRRNAVNLRIWMRKMVDEDTARGTVVVFSQDVTPNTIYFDKSDALLRGYLNKGGRAVWIGDVPFIIYGRENNYDVLVQHELIDNEIRHKLVPKPRLEQRPNDPYALLGLFPAFAFSESKVEITQVGEELGLENPWYSIMPIHKRYLAPWWHPFLRAKYILANSILRPPLRAKDVNPQRMTGEGASAFSSIKGATDFLHTSFSLPAVIFGLLALIYGGVVAGIGLFSFEISGVLLAILLLIPFFSIIFLLGWIFYSVYQGFSRKKFASAWIKKFDNGGEFIRIWDCRPEDIPISMRKDLYQIATNNI